MIVAVDTCVLVDFQSGVVNAQVMLLEEKLLQGHVSVPSVVITEFLSNPRLDKKHYHFLQDIRVLEIYDGYWQRAAEIRKLLLNKGLKSKLGDALIAQACIDNSVALLTRDDDFRHYAKHCGLQLVSTLGN